MTHPPHQPLERALAIARRDHLHPIPCVRTDTGEVLWLVQSRSQMGTHYLLTKQEGRIHCPCPAAQHGPVCAHAAAVYLLLQEAHPALFAALGCMAPDPSTAPTEEEQQRQEAALRRERALLWTDNRPFSIWK